MTMSTIIPLEYLVTFADENISSDYTWNSIKFNPNHNQGNITSYNYEQDFQSQICPSETTHDDDVETLSSPYDNEEMLSFHPYTFNPGIYQASSLYIPRNIFQTIPENIASSSDKTPMGSHHRASLGGSIKKRRSTVDPSILYYMPHWNYHSFTPSQQEQFISKYFPERIGLYRHYKLKEERDNLFVYLWLYINGGLYVSSEYEILKPLDIILDSSIAADLYFMFDHERYISPRVLASQPFCGFWMEAVNLMEKRKNHHYPQIQDQIDRNTGRGLLTDIAEETQYKYEILSRTVLDPYSPCDTTYDKDSYLRPLTHDLGFLTYMKCQTGSSDELLYITGAIIFVIAIMILIALITQ